MKVKIGNYPNRLTCHIHTRYMNKKYGYIDWPEPEQQTRFQRSLEWFEDRVQSVYNVFNWIWYDRRKQKISVKIDKWDTWSMDYTLAHIILPMLKQLKATNHGYPSTLTEQEWDKIQDKMIWAFEQKLKDDMYDSSAEEHAKMEEGFRLFGEYYQNLWD